MNCTMLNSNAGLYKCPICNQSLATKKSLQRHLKNHFGDNSYVCQICGSSFPTRPELFLHRRSHSKLYKCSECVKAFHRRDSLMRHVDIHWRVHVKCELCDKTFKNENSLNIHHRMHMGDRPYQCDLCNSSFACKEYLRGHRKKVHNVKNVLYQCDICEKIFKNSVGLGLHKISHSDDRPHICHLCPETFKYRANLKEHLRRHICPKPFKCPICSKAFSSWAGMYEHKRTHSSVREFMCETCGKSYRRNSHLARHSVSHGDEKRFACKYCGKRFKYRRAMNVHIRSHTGQRPYTCDLCGRRFAQKSRMNSHRMTHTGEKPFRCIACGKSFCRHDKLTDHCRRMHKQLIDMNNPLSSPFIRNKRMTGTSNGANQDDANHEFNNSNNAKARNNSDESPHQKAEIHTPVRKTNASAVTYAAAHSERNNGDVARNDGALNSRRRKSAVLITNGEDDCNMSLKIEVFDESELPDDFYLNDNSTEFLTDVRDAEQDTDFKKQCMNGTTAGFSKTTWPQFLTTEQTATGEEAEKLIELNNYESSNSVGDNSVVMDSDDEATEIVDSDDVTIHYLDDEEEEEEAAVVEAADDIPAAAAAAGDGSSLVFRALDHISKEGICFWSDNSSIQEDEDFLLAMRVFQLLKSHPPGVEKNSLKAQVEDMLLLDANKTSLI